jgi:5-methylcytosine-specific restriction endonuclease McrA
MARPVKKYLRNGVVRIIRANYSGGLRSEGWNDLRLFVLKRDGYKCLRCGRTHKELRALGIELQVNHIKPKCRGGTDAPSNLMSECAQCHSREYRHQRMKVKANLAKKKAKEKRIQRISATKHLYR